MTLSIFNSAFIRRHRWKLMILLLISVFYVAPRLWTTLCFWGRAHTPILDGNFSKFEVLIPPPSKQIANFHEGLPHNAQAGMNFLYAVWLTSTVNIHGYPFKAADWKPSAHFSELVHDTLSNKASFTGYVGPKLCGGFHADFTVQIGGSDEVSDVMVCLGCGEALVFSNRGSGIAELSNEAHGILYKAFQNERSTATDSH